MKQAVVLVSGGIDSTTLLHYVVKELKQDCTALSIIYGQKHSKEVDCARYQCELLGVPFDLLDLSFFGKFLSSSSLINGSKEEVPHIIDVMGDPQPSTYVPNRNMMFLSIAAAYAENLGANDVYYGAQRHDLYGYFDTTPEFLYRINYVLELNRKNQVTIKAPFVQYSKANVIALGLSLGVDYSHTYSCYSGNEKPSRFSATSAERLKAFAELGLTDPLEYAD